jgi:hypothetical protein
MTMFQYYGIITDVKSNGSCGYHALILFLQRMELVNQDISVSQFCKNIYTHIQKNMSKFTGEDGGNCVFEYTWGKSSQSLKKARNPMVRRERFMTMEVMRGI